MIFNGVYCWSTHTTWGSDSGYITSSYFPTVSVNLHLFHCRLTPNITARIYGGLKEPNTPNCSKTHWRRFKEYKIPFICVLNVCFVKCCSSCLVCDVFPCLFFCFCVLFLKCLSFISWIFVFAALDFVSELSVRYEADRVASVGKICRALPFELTSLPGRAQYWPLFCSPEGSTVQKCFSLILFIKPLEEMTLSENNYWMNIYNWLKKHKDYTLLSQIFS